MHQVRCHHAPQWQKLHRTTRALECGIPASNDAFSDDLRDKPAGEFGLEGGALLKAHPVAPNEHDAIGLRLKCVLTGIPDTPNAIGHDVMQVFFDKFPARIGLNVPCFGGKPNKHLPGAFSRGKCLQDVHRPLKTGSRRDILLLHFFNAIIGRSKITYRRHHEQDVTFVKNRTDTLQHFLAGDNGVGAHPGGHGQPHRAMHEIHNVPGLRGGGGHGKPHAPR